MKILILGAGQVGSTVAQHLAREEANEVTVVDIDAERLQEMQDRLDIRTVRGMASYPDVLARAGADDAEMIVAVTDSDETNMVACQVAYTLYHTPTKIARIRATEYIQAEALFVQEAMPVDVVISPEKLVMDYIRRLIQYPGALQVLDFADGRVRLVAVRAYYGGPLVGNELRNIRDHLPNLDARVAAIYRRGEPIIPEGDTVIEADDEVFFIAAREDIRQVISELRKLDRPARRVIIAGGGNIGERLAAALEETHNVKLIERDKDRARQLSERLDKTIVLHGDAADEELFRDENIEHVDVFCGVTNAEEANILSSMLAKHLGAKKTMALINRPSYVDLVQSGAIDIAISPQQITIGSLLTHIRRGDVVAVHSLRRGAAEAIEAVAHGDPDTSEVVGKAIEDIALPPGTTIGAIVRDKDVIMGHRDIVIEPEDHVILFLVDRKYVPAVERLFQVDVTFI
ncbi:Trk system potassium transporter TrkA [Natronospira bacteriovora]|uniref:Trk system potassium uptake protein TrkA n=1 Tax=Natronospira bacteriovora TaxID=3069753 RepID=A0ABU0W6N1_9GAMM|nr:Trk system potassium transporter TrkA [Natronospira sp. AB-CW4]MDQ2069682.1 Trk system potassium transporter TrkA [Natronospira sp. AB-CW4]